MVKHLPRDILEELLWKVGKSPYVIYARANTKYLLDLHFIEVIHVSLKTDTLLER